MFQIDSSTLVSQRADKYLAAIIPHMSRNQITQCLSYLLINGTPASLSKTIKRGDRVQAKVESPPPTVTTAEEVPLDIIYEDDHIVVINKPTGLVAHPSHGHLHGTISQGLVYRYESLREWPESAVFRPGIVHRLDKETSGVMVAAKDVESAYRLQEQFRFRKVKKDYIAIASGTYSKSTADINLPIARDPHNNRRFTVMIGGKNAYTHMRVIRSFPAHLFVLLQPHTGRTHQLRVHMSYCKLPIIGDTLYASGSDTTSFNRLFLHAYRLHITHPFSDTRMHFRAPIPPEFFATLRMLRDGEI